MKYVGMPMAMWIVFEKSFRRNLTDVLGIDTADAGQITKKAKKEYKELLDRLPELPEVEQATVYYRESAMTGFMKWFCRQNAKRQYSPKDIQGMKETAKLRAGDRNPYSWNMDFYEYPDGSGYEARFSKCGICALMKELGLEKLIPAMCRLDYSMSEAGGGTEFVREYTLASGGPYCDCGYKKKGWTGKQ